MDEYLQNNLKDIIKQAIWDPYTLVLRKHSQEDKWQEVTYYDLVEDNVIYTVEGNSDDAVKERKYDIELTKT